MADVEAALMLDDSQACDVDLSWVCGLKRVFFCPVSSA